MDDQSPPDVDPVERLPSSENDDAHPVAVGEVVAARKAFRWAEIMIGVLILTPVAYAITSRQAIDRYPFVYAQAGKELLEGRRIYQDTWIHEPPLAIILYAIPQLVAPRSIAAIAAFAGLILVAQGLLFARLFRDTIPAALATLLFITCYPLAISNFAWPSTEQFSNLFVAGSLFLGLTIFRAGAFTISQCLGIGALVCAAFHVRQNTVLCGVAPALIVLMTAQPLGKRLLGVAAMVAGALLAWAPILALMWLAGDVQMYFWTVFVYPLEQFRVGDVTTTSDAIDFLWSTSLPALMAIFGSLAAKRGQRWLVVVLVIVAIAGCLLTRRGFAHHWANTFPYVAILMGMGLEVLMATQRRIAWLLTDALAATLILPTTIPIYASVTTPTHNNLVRLAEFVEEISPRKATLLVFGVPTIEAVQFASRLAPANKYEHTYLFESPETEILPDSFDDILASYLAKPPGAILADETLVQTALAEPEAADLTPKLRLLRALLKANDYQEGASGSGYVIKLLPY